jgi:hypothetical protein
MRLAHAVGEADALVGVRRGHPDIRQHDVRPLAVDRGRELLEIPHGRDDLQLRLHREDVLDPLAGDQAVVGDHQPDAHVATLEPTSPGMRAHPGRAGDRTHGG